MGDRPDSPEDSRSRGSRPGRGHEATGTSPGAQLSRNERLPLLAKPVVQVRSIVGKLENITEALDVTSAVPAPLNSREVQRRARRDVPCVPRPIRLYNQRRTRRLPLRELSPAVRLSINIGKSYLRELNILFTLTITNNAYGGRKLQ
jgi:hypothetical protein